MDIQVLNSLVEKVREGDVLTLIFDDMHNFQAFHRLEVLIGDNRLVVMERQPYEYMSEVGMFIIHPPDYFKVRVTNQFEWEKFADLLGRYLKDIKITKQ